MTGSSTGTTVGDCTEALGYVPPVEFEMNLLNKPAVQDPEAA